VDFRDDRVEADRKNAVAEDAVRAVERLALPGEYVHELCDLRREVRAGRDDGGAFCRTVWNRTGIALREQIVEFFLRHLQQVGNSQCHESSQVRLKADTT